MADDDPGGRSGLRPFPDDREPRPSPLCVGLIDPLLYFVSRPSPVRPGMRGPLPVVCPRTAGGPA